MTPPETSLQATTFLQLTHRTFPSHKKKLGSKFVFNQLYLQTDDVSVSSGDLLDDAFLAILPAQGPGRAVAVHLLSGVFVAQHVVTHYREFGWPGRRGRGARLGSYVRVGAEETSFTTFLDL